MSREHDIARKGIEEQIGAAMSIRAGARAYLATGGEMDTGLWLTKIKEQDAIISSLRESLAALPPEMPPVQETHASRPATAEDVLAESEESIMTRYKEAHS